MFSLLSQGYGTWDGTAKKDVKEVQDQKDYFSLEDFHLPPIASNNQPSIKQDVVEHQSGPRYENKPFQLPKVENTKQSIIPKTYTTRKGALLLYTEDLFLPGSPRPRKKRRKLKRQPSVKLKTLGDLRDVILDYKNGGDPLFLALLQKRLSGYKENAVRPGFSPKRYIAIVGNSLEEDTWNRLAATGSLKDPAVLTYNPELPPFHRNKPQPYSTMSLPPISPASSMFESTFNFYKNGMSTGAASMISLNSETEEYAPSSRAISPTESLSNRLSEVEILPRKRDQYNMLNAKQKEDLLSQLLLQKTLDTLNSDLSDLQGWATNYPENAGAMEHEPLPAIALQHKPKSKHRGSLKSGSLSSIPRLPPIQSAGARPTTPVQEKEQDSVVSPSADSQVTVDVMDQGENVNQLGQGTSIEVDEDMLDLDAIHVELNLSDESSKWNEGGVEGKDETVQSREAATKSEGDLAEDKYLNGSSNLQQVEDGGITEGIGSADHERHSVSEDSVEDPNKTLADDHESVDPEDVVIEDSMTQDTADHQEQQTSESDQMEGLEDGTHDTEREENNERERAEDEETLTGVQEGVTQADNEPHSSEGATEGHRVTESDDEDEGIGLDGGELENEGDEEANQSDRQVPLEAAQQEQTAQQDYQSGVSEQQPSLSLDDLQGEARGVANRVLSRPQSGAVFMEDVRAAMVMWAERLSSLLGPPNQDARVSSAGRKISQVAGLTTQGATPIKVTTRHRKASRSAGPSLLALRQALQISGGDVPGIEALRNLPPLPQKFNRPGRGHPPSGVSSGHTYYEPSKDDVVSTKSSGSPGPARSIPWERVSNADVQADIFSYVNNDKEPSFQKEQANQVTDGDSGDEEFQEALSAVVTEVKKDYTLVEAKSKKTVSSPKKEEKPFQFPRPAASKPPAGLQNKQAPGAGKGKGKAGAKKAGAGKKKAAKKPVKQQQKPANKATKGAAKEKVETQKKDDLLKSEDVKEVKLEQAKEEKPEPPVRVDSETGEQELELSDRTVVSSLVSRVTSSRLSSKASEEFTQSKQTSPTEDDVRSAPVFPHVVPRPPEPQTTEREASEVYTPPHEEQKPQENRAARRAAERAAAAERRRQEVERKRREREEAKKRAIEEEARLEQIRLEAEEDMKKREEERRRRREEKDEANRRQLNEEEERERLEKVKAEKERRARDEWKRKQQQVIARRKLDEEMRKEQEKIEMELEAARLREEEERIKAMEESERVAFLEKIRREEEELRLKLAEQKRIEAEERREREEEKRQREETLALLRQKQLQRHLFITSILKEDLHLSLSQRLTRAFTFSYFDLIPWIHLMHLKPGSPVRELIHEVKKNIPPTIIEEDDEEE